MVPKNISILSTFIFLLASCNGGAGGQEDADAGVDARDAEAAAEEAAGDPADEGADGEAPEDAAESSEDAFPGDLADGSDAADLPEIDVEDNAASAFCEDLASAFCGYIRGCCTEEEKTGLLGVIDCDDLRGSAFFLSCYAGIGPYVADGTAEIYEAAAPGCIAIFQDMAMSCPDFNAAPFHRGWYMASGCSQVVQGLRSPSEECVSSVQCQGDYFCDDSTNPGACAPKAGAGGACGGDEECAPAAVCIFEVCSGPSPAGGNCDDDADCGLGLFCDEGSGSTCRELLEEGETCSPSADVCEGRCVGGSCTSFCDGV